ncbi:hypothetical protein LEP1GSC040_0481 [Leptospira santarosai str. 2000030832]|nr:hypothetical protein LEP1GSC040_0481 [Leptospira santarosai str. 2000030832]
MGVRIKLKRKSLFRQTILRFESVSILTSRNCIRKFENEPKLLFPVFPCDRCAISINAFALCLKFFP